MDTRHLVKIAVGVVSFGVLALFAGLMYATLVATPTFDQLPSEARDALGSHHYPSNLVPLTDQRPSGSMPCGEYFALSGRWPHQKLHYRYLVPIEFMSEVFPRGAGVPSSIVKVELIPHEWLSQDPSVRTNIETMDHSVQTVLLTLPHTVYRAASACLPKPE